MIQFLFAGYKVKARHELLSGALGFTFEQEDQAYLLVSRLLWVIPMTVTIAAFMDALLAYGYMKWAHPWVEILGTEFVVPFSSHSSSLKWSIFISKIINISVKTLQMMIFFLPNTYF